MSASVSWDATDDAVTDVYVSVSDGRVYEVPASLSSLQVSGLRNGTSYEFVVRAATEGGVGPGVSVRAVPLSGLEGEVAGLVVKFEPGVAVTDGQQLVPGESGVLQADLSVDAQVADGVHRIELSQSVTAGEAKEIARELADDPAVAWAEPDAFVTASSDATGSVLEDPEYAQQWNLWDAYGVGVSTGSTNGTAPEYTDGQGEGATVAVIDTGITAHPDLDAQIVPGYDFVSSPSTLTGPRDLGVPNVPFDGDSVDAERFGPLGWDANPTDPGDWRTTAPARASSWHGTHIAGVIAAQPNTLGVAGLAPKAKIQPIRALSWRGGLMSDVAASITWASGGTVDGVGVNPTPADVINLSFAMSGLCPASLQAAIDGANARGSVIVAAAGNANDDVANWAPANCTGVIAVGATGRDGKRAAYSNWGAGIDVSAPGGATATDGGVLSTSNIGRTGAGEPGYATGEGTSVAAAHVSAIAARVAGVDPLLTPAEITTRLTGRTAVRAFAGDACDTDPARTCGTGIVQIAAVNATPGVNMNVKVDGSLIADGSTVAAGKTVTVGTSALLSPGTGYREIRTRLDPGTVLSSGSAVAPEGWSIEYSANSGSTWTSSQPSASTVTDVRAKATVSAGLIDGTSQIYSSETTSAIPSSNFSASTGGDGWDTFFFEDYVFNIFHHSDNTVIDCHLRSTGDRCTGYKATFGGYRASMRSGGWVDVTTGKLYALTTYNATNRAGALCVDVSQSSGPVSCGFIQLSTTLSNSSNYNYITESESVGRRFYGVVYGYNSSTSTWESQLLCYDAAAAQVCPNTPVSLVGGNYDRESLSNVRPLKVGSNIVVKTSTRIYCYVASTMEECADQSKWPVTINSPTKTPISPHVTASGVVDGVCYESGCYDLTGDLQAGWTTPFSIGGKENNNWAMHAVTGGLGGTRYFWAGEPTTVYCFDFATNAKCTGSFNKSMPEQGLVYATRIDPENDSCIWVNGDAGRISVFDAQTGNTGCSNNPVITLQPSQFAPRYACSTTNGIQEWTTLRLVSIGGGGSAGTVKLTVRDATGSPVTDWTNRTVAVNTPVDMTGLSVNTTGSRPTFSFAFSSITGSISTAVIALDYKGKGPELCIDTIATAPTPPRNVTLTGKLTEQVGAEEVFTATRAFTIGTSSSLTVQSVPSAPISVTGTGINTTATLTFSPPTSNGNLDITGYQISTAAGSTNSGLSWSDATVTDNGDGTLSTRVTGLTAGQTYTFLIAAVNSLGRGDSASRTITMQLASMDNLVDTPLNLGPVTLQPQTAQSRTITYTSSTPSVCTVPASGATNIVTLVSVGTCTIRAQEAGDNTATPVIAALDQTGSFSVLPAYYEPELPGVPRNLVATPGNTQMSLSWAAPASDGNSAITDYIVQYKSGASWIPFNDGTSTGTTAIVPGLTNGTAYSFRVAAVNSVGTGTYTDSISATPATLPGSATSLAASGTGTSRTLTWTAPTSNGGASISDYTVEYKLASDTTWTSFADGVGSTTGATVTGLTNGSSYDFRVAAVNSIGTGSFVSTVNLTATGGNEQVALSWTQPTFTGGEVFDHYAVQYRVNGTSTWLTFADPVATTSTTVTGLTNGTAYDFRIANVTTTSTASYSSVATQTPLTTPAAPSDVAAAPGNRQVTLTWTAPSNGGSAITDYVIQFRTSPSGSWTTVTDPVSATTGVVVTSLPNGTSFDFRVAAVNAVGTSSYSAIINATPRTTAGAVGALTRTPGNGSVQLSWTSPSTTGGASVTDYLIEYRASTAFDWSTFVDGVSASTTSTVVGLTNGTLYEFRVSPINDAGTGTASNIVSATPYTTPGDPRSVSAAVTGLAATVTWQAPTSNGGSPITDYDVQYKLSTASDWQTVSHSVSTSTSMNISLQNAGTYDFRVAAVNAAGTGSYVSTVNLTATAGDGTVTLTWPTPDLGGASLTRYEVLYAPTGMLYDSGSLTVHAQTIDAGVNLSWTVTGLTNGSTYDFQVRTVTDSTASYSSVISASPLGAPSAPQSLAAVAGNQQVSLTWSSPASTGGAAITDYRIQYRAHGTSSWSTYVDGVSTTASARVPGLTNGTEYDFQVAAINAQGVGAYATAVQATPFTVPGQPTSLSATPGVTVVDLSWSAPASDGGSAITEYVVEYKTSAATSWTTWSRTSSATATTESVTSLTNGTLYQFRVSAKNVAGTGAVSNAVSATPKTVPGAPTALAATIGDQTVNLSWTAPSDNGGSSVTDYRIEMKESSAGSWTVVNDGVRTLPSASIGSLTNSTAYDFRVSAINEVGTGTTTSTVTATPLATPDAPTLSATFGNAQVALAWTAPANNGGAPITDYVVQYRVSTSSSWTTASDGTNTNTSYTVTGLTNGSLYYFKVAAVNSAGTGAFASAVSATPMTTPSQPSAPTVTRGNTQLSVSWTAPANGGSAITDYIVEVKASTESSWTTFADGSGTGTSTVITGLTNGTAYNVRISAVNVVGTGTASSSGTGTPSTVAGTVVSLGATPGNVQVVLAWSVPSSNGGAAITDYIVQYKLTSAGSWSTFSDGTSTSTGATVTGLTNGSSYDFQVAAVNAAGTGSYATSVTATPRTLPGTPTALTATRGDAQVSLTWTAPASNGGAAITDYVVQYKLTSAGSWSTFSDGTSTTASATVTGLVNGSAYSFQVAAVNAAGTGTYSGSASATPLAAPAAPGTIAITPSSATLQLGWTAPSDNGGTAITDYVVEYRLRGASSWTSLNRGSATASYTLASLLNGSRYEVRVAAVNSIGTGAYAVIAEGTPYTLPGAPTSVAVSSGPATMALSWSAPASDGGSAITDYVIEVQDPDTLVWSVFADGVSASTSATLTGYTVGASYAIRIAAVNAAGTGPTSSTVTGSPAALVFASSSTVTDTDTDTPIPVKRPKRSNGPLRLATPVVSMAVDLPEDESPVMTLEAPEPVQATAGTWIQVQGDGYAPQSTVTVSLVPTSGAISPQMLMLAVPNSPVIQLGTLSVESDGSFSGRLSLPMSVAGAYTLRIEGMSPTLESRTMELEMAVQKAPTSMTKRAFFKPRSKEFSASGLRKLSSLAVQIKAMPTDRVIQVTGVSVSMTSMERNVDLAAARAKRLVRWLKSKGVAGTYEITFRTSGTFAPARAKAARPLSTVQVVFPVG